MLSSFWDLFEHFNLFFIDAFFNDADQNRLAWFYLLITVFSQYYCIRSVYCLTTECSSLTVTLCVTSRKFLSLIFSIFYFGNAFTIIHWYGSIIVFGGIILFYTLDLFFEKKQKLIQQLQKQSIQKKIK